MGVIGWIIILSLPFYALGQIWVLIRLGKHLELSYQDQVSLPDPATGHYTTHTTTQKRPKQTTSMCRQCGTYNEPGYRYCAHCITKLPNPK